jgi:ACR3 family arsenite efflux pump ArsB
MVRQTVGSWELEKVWVALAGSYTKVNAENKTKRFTYMKYFLHLLHPFPVFTVKAKIGILFAFEGRHFIGVIRQFDKQVNTL